MNTPKSFKLHSLPLKIFLIIWLTNIFIMMATSFVVIDISESRHILSTHQTKIALTANNIIKGYESEKNFINPGSHNSLLSKEPLTMHPITILNAQGNIVFQSTRKKMKNRNLYSFNLTSAKGYHYKIITIKPRANRILMEWLNRLHSLQMILITIGAAIISLFLSFLIVHPLKKLGFLSDKLANGELQRRLDKNLISRKDEIGQLARKFDNMANKIHNSIDNQRELLHMTSHELRAPLARLQACAALALKQDSPINHSSLEKINNECTHINKLIQAILNLARIQPQTSELNPIDLDALIRKNFTGISQEFPQHVINYTGDSQTIQGQESLLYSAIENILRNACLYTDKGTIIDIQLNKTELYYEIKIRDHGKGVNEGALNKILRPFYRQNHHLKSKGFGLGLSISQKVMRLHQGQLKLRNHPDGGLEVTLSIPAHKNQTLNYSDSAMI